MSMFYCHWCDNYIDGDYDECHEDPNPNHPDFSLVCHSCWEEHLVCAECGEGKAELKAESKAPGWISVKDRLPESDIRVLVAGCFHDVLVYSGGVWLGPVSDPEQTYAPTHWLPLPEPPRG